METFIKNRFEGGTRNDSGRYFRKKRSDGVLFPVTLAQYEKAVAQAAAALQLDKLQVVPHTFRHTGPSHDVWTSQMSLPEVQARGHWATMQSVRGHRTRGVSMC